MRFRAGLSFVFLVAAVGCAGVVDAPVGPAVFAASVGGSGDGDPPPPPIDTGGTDIEIEFNGTEFRPAGRYFANKPGTNAWLEFATREGTTASSNARLQYHPNSGKTNGKGTLSFGGATLDLSRVRIIEGSFGSCPAPGSPTTGDGFAACGSATFTTSSGGVGELRVYPRGTGIVTPP